jgi:hypothetical protein
MRCKDILDCDPTDLLCREYGKYPDAASCTLDAQCLHGWCSGRSEDDSYCSDFPQAGACAGKCATPIADGKACDGADPTKNRCVVTDYCKYPENDSAGKCVKRLTAGVKCIPRFLGADCLNRLAPPNLPYTPGNCAFANDAFVCDSSAIPDGKLFCDGP